MLSEQAAQCLIEVAASAIRTSPKAFPEVLDELAPPIYLTDRDGTLTYFNNACISLAGRTPRVGTDKWCVTWKIYRTDGEYLPHDSCPMAVAIRERRSIRGVEAIAERPDGTRINFIPHPTPLFDDDGAFAGAINLLLDVTAQRRPECRSIARVRPAPDELRMETIETLARVAARIAGRDPDDHATIKLGDVMAFDDLMWRYPDFLARAEAAYHLLERGESPNEGGVARSLDRC
jgi:PAS domain-containing protein